MTRLQTRPAGALPVILAALAIAVALAVPAAAQEDGGSDAFRIERLNAGLGPAPEGLDRSTPRATLEAFLTYTDRGEFAEAAHLLDLAPVATEAQAELGPVLAARFSHILGRKIPIDWDVLPDRPDGMVTTGSDREPMVGETRRSISIGSLELDRWPVGVRLNRVSTPAGDPVWVFSRQTVEHIDALHEKFGPTWIERMMPAPLRAEAPVLGLGWWELIAIPIVLVVAAAVGVVLNALLTRIADRARSDHVSLGVRRVRLPVVLLTVAVCLRILVTSVFVFSAATASIISALFWLLIVAALLLGAARILDTVIDAASKRYIDNIDDPQNTAARHWYTNLSAAKRIGLIVVGLVGIAIALSELRVFENFGLSLLVAAGAATAIFGLAAQTVLGNILASLQIALAKPIRIGDAVFYDDHWAYVERINYTFVQLRTWDQKRYIVPVKNLVSTAFENWTREDAQLTLPVLLKLDHRADVEALRRVFHEIAPKDPDWAEDATPKVQVIGQDEDGIDVRFYCTASNPTAAWNLHCRMRERIIAMLREEDEPSDLPRTRLAYVENTLERNVSEESVYEDGFVDATGEPKARPLRPRTAGSSRSVTVD